MAIRKITDDEIEQIRELSIELDDMIHDLLVGFTRLNEANKSVNIIISAIKASLIESLSQIYIFYLDGINIDDINRAKNDFCREIDLACDLIKKSIMKYKK